MYLTHEGALEIVDVYNKCTTSVDFQKTLKEKGINKDLIDIAWKLLNHSCYEEGE